MKQDHSPTFTAAFIARTKQLREAAKRTQEDMAIAMGLPLETYRKYETRSPMPLRLVERFATIVQGDLVFLITGRQSDPKPQRRTRPAKDARGDAE